MDLSPAVRPCQGATPPDLRRRTPPTADSVPGPRRSDHCRMSIVLAPGWSRLIIRCSCGARHGLLSSVLSNGMSLFYPACGHGVLRLLHPKVSTTHAACPVWLHRTGTLTRGPGRVRVVHYCLSAPVTSLQFALLSPIPAPSRPSRYCVISALVSMQRFLFFCYAAAPRGYSLGFPAPKASHMRRTLYLVSAAPSRPAYVSMQSSIGALWRAPLVTAMASSLSTRVRT